MDDLVITITDVRRAGHCVSGARRWFERHGLDFRHFLKHGIPAADMLATGDAQGRQVVERTVARRAEGGADG